MPESILNRLRRPLRQVLATARVAARSNLAYSGEVLSRTVFLAVILYIFFKLWQATYGQSHSTVLGGLTLNQMLWYLTITEAITMSAPRLAQQIDEDVRSGTLAVRLLKPIDYPLYCLSTTLGERLVRFLANLATGGLITLCLVGPPQLAAEAWLMLSLVVLPAFVLDGLGNLLIGLLAFWLEDTSGLVLIYSRLTMILGGMLIPIELFPHWLKEIVVLLPFPYLIWAPAHLFVQPESQTLVKVLMAQAINIAVLLVAMRLLYSRALGRISAHGG